ncbi:MAG: Ig-like domain-containing protein [Deltaproteobacteria bacterium]|nr:Ig-like domain-containing protein [Deltaproteobacteria bacterium]
MTSMIKNKKMADEKIPPEKTENTAAGTAPETEANADEAEVLLDKTRMDMDLSGSIKEEPTSDDGGTDIRIDSGFTPKPKISISERLSPLFGIFRSVKIPKLGPLFSRLGMVVLGLPFFYLLVGCVLFAFKNEAPAKWILLAASALAAILSLITLLVGKGGPSFLVFPITALLSFAGAHLLLFSGNDPLFFTLLGRPPAEVMSEFWAALFILQMLLILVAYPGKWIGKGLLSFLALAAAAYFILGDSPDLANLLASFPPEAEPGFVIMNVYLTLLFLVSFLWFFFSKSPRKRWVGANLFILLLASLVGQAALHQSRLPNALSFIIPSELPVGSAILITEGDNPVTLRVETKNFKTNFARDDRERARFSLAAAKDKFLLKASRADDSFLNLTGSDLKVWANGHSIKCKMSKGKKGYLLTLLSSPKPPLPEENNLKTDEPSVAAKIPGLEVLSPSPGDSFSGSLPVAVNLSPPEGKMPGTVRFFIDDVEKEVKDSPPYQVALDTAELSTGNHTLKVSALLQNPSDLAVLPEEMTQSVPVTKGEHPQAFFVRPTLGEFLSQKTPVEISVAADPQGGLPASIELLLKETKIHEWTAPPYTFEWDTSALTSGEYFLRLKSKTAAGVQTSDWVSVLTGQGGIKINAPAGDRQYDKVVFIIDASVSLEDLWGEKTKWEWVKGLFLGGKSVSQLRGSQMGIVLGGNKVYHQHADCRDADWGFLLGPYNSKGIKGAFKESAPRGVFPLFASLSKALEAKPKKIIVVADGADSCAGKIPQTLASKIRREEILVDVVTLGALNPKDEKVLKELAETGGGHYLAVSSGEELEEEVQKALSFHFQLLDGEKVVLEEGLTGAFHSLKPGNYTLKVSMDPPLPPQTITLRHQMTTTVKLELVGGKATAKEEYAPLVLP